MKGKCLCGAIEVVADDHAQAHLCHCTTCRRWSGGPMFAVHVAGPVTFNGQTPATYASSDWAARGFCRTCGTHLYYHLLPDDTYVLPIGLFQEQAFDLSTELFIDEKPDFYALGNLTRKLTGPEVFEQFSQPS